MWVAELMNGHPECIKAELGMRLHVFLALVDALSAVGLRASQHISLEQHIANFSLCMCNWFVHSSAFVAKRCNALVFLKLIQLSIRQSP